MVPAEVWAGVECSYNRVGEEFFDQLSKNGHRERLADLDLFASLGFKKLRYPVLWEHIAPQSLATPDWLWPDERLARLRELEIEPIVGLVHHGSGPVYTSLTSANFAPLLAQYAGMVAARYPWVNYYTPVNEPLTTARFSGLYGFWYPHGTSDAIFVRALLTQLQGTKMAMQAIRRVNPQAKLVQTEDLGKTFSTPLLAYQATFENERRWLTFDLLCGQVTPQHNLWEYLKKADISDAELFDFVDDPFPPDIFGINHYITSERYLDERLALFPLHTHGQNTEHRYADVEAVRVKGIERAGTKVLLQDTWERYHAPIAITEAHLGCTREEQLRWFMEIWQAAADVKEAGVNCLAVTAWALLGSYDWNTLLTRHNGHYENGVFDLRSNHGPRPTALADMLQQLSHSGTYQHEILPHRGWWNRKERYLYRSKERITSKPASNFMMSTTTSPLLITGATGTLGQAFARICQDRGLPYRLLNRTEMDITNRESVEAAVAEYKPWAIINAAGYVRVDDAEQEADTCFRENTTGPTLLAEVCKEAGVQLVTFSSDLVFDGTKGVAYTEDDMPNPRNVYGQSKADAEKQVLNVLPGALVIRTSAFFGVWDHYNFVYYALQSLVQGTPFMAADDVIISPTYVPDLVHATLDLLIDKAGGIWHLTNQGAYTWAELAQIVADIALLQDATIDARPVSDFQLAAYRPANTALQSSKISVMPSVEDALHRCVPIIVQALLKEKTVTNTEILSTEPENLVWRMSS